jgi:hypothetical protein
MFLQTDHAGTLKKPNLLYLLTDYRRADIFAVL